MLTSGWFCTGTKWRRCGFANTRVTGTMEITPLALIQEPGNTVSVRLPKGFQVATSVEFNRHTFSGFLLYQLIIQWRVIDERLRRLERASSAPY
ncbi:hypothetical protein SRHO_G00018910 [Serrasalmus rhombeus]